MLSREAATRILAYLDANPWVMRAFRRTLLPDEMLFQTVINHLRIDVDPRCATRTLWIEGRPSPEIITRETIDVLVNDWQFFLRKFDQDGGELVPTAAR